MTQIFSQILYIQVYIGRERRGRTEGEKGVNTMYSPDEGDSLLRRFEDFSEPESIVNTYTQHSTGWVTATHVQALFTAIPATAPGGSGSIRDKAKSRIPRDSVITRQQSAKRRKSRVKSPISTEREGTKRIHTCKSRGQQGGTCTDLWTRTVMVWVWTSPQASRLT